MSDKNNLRPDLGWIVAFTLLGMFFVFVVVQFPAVRDLACKAKEEDCFRQWMSALGGWAAVLAAVPTIYFLSKQIETSTREQRVNFALNIRADTALVRTVKLAAHEAERQIENFTRINTRDVRDPERQVAMLTAQLELLAEHMQRSAFGDFEVRISPSSNITHHTITAYLESRVAKARSMAGRTEVYSVDAFDKELEDLSSGLKYAQRYVTDVLAAVADYERDVARLEENYL